MDFDEYVASSSEDDSDENGDGRDAFKVESARWCNAVSHPVEGNVFRFKEERKRRRQRPRFVANMKLC